MGLTFRRRIIQDVGPSGYVYKHNIPYDPKATDDEDALVRHFRRLSWIKLPLLDPDLLLRLIDSRLGRFILGSVEVSGGNKNRDGSMRGSLGRWEDRVETSSRPLTDDEREERLYRDQPLMRKVSRRLRAEHQDEGSDGP